MSKSGQQNAKIEGLLWIIFIIALVFVYFFALGSIPLLGPDEPRYAQVAREMYERGDWITPTLGGANWFEKPALAYWLMILSYKIFGVDEFAARFGSAVSGLLTVLTLFYLGTRVQLATTRRSYIFDNTGNLARFNAVLLGSSLGLLVFSRGASFDIVLTFPLTAALTFFLTADLREKRDYSQTYSVPKVPQFSYLYLALFYFFVGVSILAKGLVGAVLPFGIIFLYFVFQTRFPPKKFILSLFWGLPITILTAAIWYLPMYERHGWQFVDEFFIQHHFARFTSNKYLHPQPFYFFFWVLPLMTLPWLFNFLAALRNIGAWRWRMIIAPVDRLRLFAFAWLIVPVVFFSLSGSKLPGYILPSLPAAVLLAAEWTQNFCEQSARRVNYIHTIAIAFLLAAAIALGVFAEPRTRRETSKQLMAMANARGFTTQKVLNLHGNNHSLEFYAPNRLVRLPEGRQKTFFGVTEIGDYLRQTNEKSVLVVVPNEYAKQMREYRELNVEEVFDNGEDTIFFASSK